MIPELPTIYDEPFADSSQVPTYLLSKLTRQHVTVALSGDGGDELFAGYTRHRFARALAGLPASVGKGLACGLGVAGPALWDRLFSLVPAARRPTLAGDKMLKAAAMLKEGGAGAYRSLVSAWDEPERVARKGRELKGAIFDPAVESGAPRWARAHAISRHADLSSRRHSHQGRSRQHGGRARGARADPRSPRRRAVLAAAVALQDAARQGQMAAPPGALPPCAASSRRAPEIGLRHSHRSLAQRPAQALGRGAFVRTAARRGRTARACADHRALAASISPASATGMRRSGPC